MKMKSKLLVLCSALSFLSFGVMRYLLGGWIPFFWILIALTIGLFIAALIIERRLLIEFFTMKTTKQGMNMGLSILLVFGCLLAVNFLSVRHYATFDFSSARLNTLSDQSKNILKSLDAPLKVLFFYKNGAEGNDESRKSFREVIKKYQDESKWIELEFVEVNERPDLVDEYGVKEGNGIAFVNYKGRKNRVEKIEEQEFTSAILKAMNEKEISAYVILGHGEPNLEDSKEINGLGVFKSLLKGNRYSVKPLVLNQTMRIPEDAQIVFALGATQSYASAELAAIRDYLKSGGRLIVAEKANHQSSLKSLFSEYGVEFSSQYIFNLVQTAFGEGVNQGETMVSDFTSQHEIVKPFGAGQFLRMRYPQSFSYSEKIKGLKFEAVAKASVKTVSFEDIGMKKEAGKGPFTVVAKLSGLAPEGKNSFQVIFFGDSDLFGNQLLYQNLNRDLVLNSLASLVGNQQLISISPREVGVTQMELTETGLSLFIFAFLIPLPLLFMGASIGFWYRRRNA